MLLGLTYGLFLPLATAGLLLAATFAGATGALRLTRHWRAAHDRLNAVLGLASFASVLGLFYVYFVLAIWFWYQFA